MSIDKLRKSEMNDASNNDNIHKTCRLRSSCTLSDFSILQDYNHDPIRAIISFFFSIRSQCKWEFVTILWRLSMNVNFFLDVKHSICLLFFLNNRGRISLYFIDAPSSEQKKKNYDKWP